MMVSYKKKRVVDSLSDNDVLQVATLLIRYHFIPYLGLKWSFKLQAVALFDILWAKNSNQPKLRSPILPLSQLWFSQSCSVSECCITSSLCSWMNRHLIIFREFALLKVMFRIFYRFELYENASFFTLVKIAY